MLDIFITFNIIKQSLCEIFPKRYYIMYIIWGLGGEMGLQV